MVLNVPTKNRTVPRGGEISHPKGHVVRRTGGARGGVWCLESPAPLPQRRTGEGSAVLRGSTRRLPAAPGFQHEGAHNEHNEGRQAQAEEVAQGVVLRGGTWGGWETGPVSTSRERSTRPSRVALPDGAPPPPRVCPGRWSAQPPCTRDAENTTCGCGRVAAALPRSSRLCLLPALLSPLLVWSVCAFPRVALPFSLLTLGTRLRSSPRAPGRCAER